MNNFSEYFYNNLKRIVKESDLLTSQNTHKLLLIVIDDYSNKKIDLKILSYVATQLFYELNKPSDFDKNDYSQELGNILSEISELEFYSNSSEKNESNKKMAIHILEKMNLYRKRFA